MTVSCIVIGVAIVLLLLAILKSPSKARLEHFLAETRADLQELETLLRTQEETITELKRINGLNRQSIKKLKDKEIANDLKYRTILDAIYQADEASQLETDKRIGDLESSLDQDMLIIKEHINRIAELEGELAKLKKTPAKKPRKPYTKKKK